MKRTLLIAALLLIQIGAFAQDTSWTKSMSKIYGSKVEKHQQDEIAAQSESRMLCRFIGFKSFYEQGISDYLQSHEYTMDNAFQHGATVTYKLTKNGVYIGTKAPKVYITFTHSSADRILSGRLTGPFNTLAFLFLSYWPQDALFATEDQLKPGTTAVKHCYGDLISFKWNGATPYITITKDPNINVPVLSSN
jgi:hypothetical protein